MKRFLIYDMSDLHYEHGFYMDAETRREAVKRAKETGACKMYGIENPVAFTREEVEGMLNA